MRVAVCISGAFRKSSGGRNSKETPSRSFQSIRKNIFNVFKDADFYFSTWNTYEKEYKQIFFDEVVIFNEPLINYHPYSDINEDQIFSSKLKKTINSSNSNKEFFDHSSNQTKQIIAHALLTDNIKNNYDVIIRARHDTFVSRVADFTNFIEDAYQNERAIGFATLNEHLKSFNTAHEMKNNGYVNKFLFDQLIIHHSKLIDLGYVMKMNNDKKLISAEFGWYQILSQRYGDNHRCISGLANPISHVNEEFVK